MTPFAFVDGFQGFAPCNGVDLLRMLDRDPEHLELILTILLGREGARERMEIPFTVEDQAGGRIVWRLTNAAGAFGELLAIEHPNLEFRGMVEQVIRENALGVHPYGHAARDLSTDAVGIALALARLAELIRFTYELPADWPVAVEPPGESER